jgi:hypothetical protein
LRSPPQFIITEISITRGTLPYRLVVDGRIAQTDPAWFGPDEINAARVGGITIEFCGPDGSRLSEFAATIPGVIIDEGEFIIDFVEYQMLGSEVFGGLTFNEFSQEAVPCKVIVDTQRIRTPQGNLSSFQAYFDNISSFDADLFGLVLP